MTLFAAAKKGVSVAGLTLVMLPLQGLAHGLGASADPAVAEHDGQRDFDFEIGTWKSHGSRLSHPLSGKSSWAEFDGVTTVRKIWNGRANLVELIADGPAGHIENLSLRLYDPPTRQWSLYYGSYKSGELSVPPVVGKFTAAGGEFFDDEMLNGKPIRVRNVWNQITADHCHFEQAFSADGGKTWELNWVVTDTRVDRGPDGTR
jgi:hypothetical protein